MCAVDDADQSSIWQRDLVKARKSHRCDECARTIEPGELYERVASLYDGSWWHAKTCRHCTAAGLWLDHWCGGWLRGGLSEEIGDHWDEYRPQFLGRCVLGMRRHWRGGTDRVPVLTAAAFPKVPNEGTWKADVLATVLEEAARLAA